MTKGATRLGTESEARVFSLNKSISIIVAAVPTGIKRSMKVKESLE